MRISVTKEYKALIEKKRNIESEMRHLPIGYISKKVIKGNTQYYLQRREGTRVVGTYIRNNEVESVSIRINKRKAYTDELAEIAKRLEQLEKAAMLIDKNLYCQFMLYKLSSGMDELNFKQKEIYSSFGNAINAIEGVTISNETSNDIEEWKSGNKSFLSVFEDTLRRYGFPVEKR